MVCCKGVVTNTSYVVQKAENMAVGIRCADHATLSIRKRWHQFRR
jgi:hypothetical protein